MPTRVRFHARWIHFGIFLRSVQTDAAGENLRPQARYLWNNKVPRIISRYAEYFVFVLQSFFEEDYPNFTNYDILNKCKARNSRNKILKALVESGEKSAQTIGMGLREVWEKIE